MQAKSFPVVLEDAIMLSPKVKHFIFRSTQNPPFHYLPGQFITVHFEHDGKMLRRSYSIANIPTDNNCIEFAAGFVENGPGTQFLFNLKVGDSIQISGPFGRLILKDEVPKRYIMVATSTGVTPFRAMLTELEHRLTQDPELNVVILLGVQKREDTLYREEFLNFAAKNQRFQFRAHLSRESVDNLHQHEFCGYVQHAFPELNLNHEQDRIYLCGNPAMIDESFNYLKEHGFTTQQVIREKYIS